MKVKAKYKICRRLGTSVFEKCQTKKFELSESRRKRQRRRRRQSKYGDQLIEKQKVRFTYGINERQFRRYVREALKGKGDPIESLYRRLEQRLDNVVFRMGLAPTRAMARQLVSHGHIDVNGRRINIPSHTVLPGDVVSVRKRSRDKGPFRDLEEEMEQYATPTWVAFDAKQLSGNIAGNPSYDPTESNMDLTAVIEFYSR